MKFFDFSKIYILNIVHANFYRSSHPGTKVASYILSKRLWGAVRISVFFVKWTDGDYFLDSYLVIWRRLLVACSLRSQEKHLKIFRALRAPCFVSKFSEKTPLCGFWSDDTRIKKLFLLFFPPPLSLLARAARRNFRFFPGIFLLKRSQDEVRSV